MPVDARVAERLRTLPKIDDLLRRPELAAVVGEDGAEVPRWAVAQAARAEVERRRQGILGGVEEGGEVASEDVARTARVLARPSLRPVINATGVVLHTNFGRAPLSEEAIARVVAVARDYSNLEYDVEARARGSRHVHVRAALCELTGAEAAIVVNNGAAAVLLAVAALAGGREVVVSRGELIEIGGSFRIPDVTRQSGARLVEVGTTNKTHRRDVEDAVASPGADVALLLKVHRSNFAMLGFVADVALEELVDIGRARGVPVMVDLGSGALVDLAAASGGTLAAEPTVSAAVATGADVVCFSGDKLLGGPQAGILVGRAAAIARLAAHPLMRALRPDKLTLAALEGTLAAYRRGPAAAVADLPALHMLCAPEASLRALAESIVAQVGPIDGLVIEAIPTTSAVGGGALPLSEPPSWAVSLPESLEPLLRASDPPIIGRIADGRLLLDVRTLRGDGVAKLTSWLASLRNRRP